MTNGYKAERERLAVAKENNPWKKWGPYLSDRQWGTVREDYSDWGSAWQYVTHDMSRSKAYRWGEEGIAGISDNKSYLCCSIGLWNGKDSILKERLFGLGGNEGVHGEDVKEIYYYLDSTPTHTFMKMLYKYPQEEFPYKELVEENYKRTKKDPEYELMDTGIFDEDNYFDVYVEYAKGGTDDILIKYIIHNRSTEAASLHVLPTVWFRNTWAWGHDDYKPNMKADGPRSIKIDHKLIGEYHLYTDCEVPLLFCENETNTEKLFGNESKAKYFKDGINDYVVNGVEEAINEKQIGTKAAAHYQLTIAPGESQTIKLRLTNLELKDPFADYDHLFYSSLNEANEFYDIIQRHVKDPELRSIQRQAYGGMMWSKQFYFINVEQWLKGDPTPERPVSEMRKKGRNHEWKHLNNSNIISMPDKWEYPWYAAWDLAFHCIPIARIDSDFAKRQLVIMVREYYMHPNGQIPAYEWSFSDVNPPVHAWATWRVYEIDKEMNHGKGDVEFLERVFHKLLMNFTWWVNQKDTQGHNIFEGGFLGLDNIGVFDRSKPLPIGGRIEQADGTAWMAMYSLNMLRIATELSILNPSYQDIASKFFEHFLFIARALNNIEGDSHTGLWDEEDQFFYDVLSMPDGTRQHMKVRSMVGLIPLYAVEILSPELLEKLPDFKRRLEWVLSNKPELAGLVSRWFESGKGETRLLSLLRGHRMTKVLTRMLDESEFLSDYGVRALSKFHKDKPYEIDYHGQVFSVSYKPAESDSTMFGGNSNWRGPIWFPVNYMIFESLLKFHNYYGDDFRIEFPSGSRRMMTLKQVAMELGKRLVDLFRTNEEGMRPVFGIDDKFQSDPHFKDHILFYEYFNGDNGRGIGASHQTGWTGLVAEIIDEISRNQDSNK
jgi:hypothetical protein